MGTSSTIKEIKKNKSRVFRRVSIKRRQTSDGLFESDWFDITKDVRRWGSIKSQIDSSRPGKITFSNIRLQMANDFGKYNPEDQEGSHWFGYAARQRTLVKIETGFVHQTQGSSGIWTNTEYPTSTTAYIGIVSGDIFLSDRDTISLNIKPLTQIFRDYPARNLTGWTSTGITASQFCEILRDQTDGSGSYVFRPFFGDTTTNWSITSTTNVYGFLNTSGAAKVVDRTCWDLLEKLAEAEDYIPYVTRSGVFRFIPKDTTSTVSYEFYGHDAVNKNREYGPTIKKINRWGKKITNFYSKVQVKFNDADTITSYVETQTSLVVNGTNQSWLYGLRTYVFENLWIAGTSVAETIAGNLYNEFSTIKNEIEFSTSFVPHLNILDRVEITYNPTNTRGSTDTTQYWDLADWDTEFTWDDGQFSSLSLVGAAYKLISIDLNLDTLESKFIAKEI